MSQLRAFFEDLAERWDSYQSPDRDHQLRQLLAPYAPLLSPAGDILDIGTGTGAIIPHLREAAPTAHLVSIDLASEMLRRARQHCPEAALLQADVHHLPLVTRSFDLVICHNSFPHFADKPRSVSSLADVLRPSGHLLILHNLSREQVNAIHRSGGAAIQNDLLPPGAETGQMLFQAGFADISVEDSDQRYVIGGRLSSV